MGNRNFNLREGTENKSVMTEAILQPLGSLGFGISIVCAWGAMERLIADQIPSVCMMVMVVILASLNI